MLRILVTLLTSQEFKGWLKEVGFIKHISHIINIRYHSQLSSGLLNEVA